MAWKHSAKIKSPRRWRRDLWVGFKPYGIGETKPNAYREMARTVWDNRRSLRYAWRILRKGVCDGCALGVAGFHDWTLSGVHLCTTRLSLLKVNTMPALDPTELADAATLRRRSNRELRDLGRLAVPMVRRRGDAGFQQVTWDAALTLVGDALRAAAPDRLALYLTARGLTNESYYAAGKLVRFLGSPNIDNAARVCHAPSTVVLKETIGVGATTCSYTDVIESDLIVLFGSNVANAQPVFMKYLYLARKRGAKVIVVNPYREPGLDRYWVPSSVESAMFGTKMADEFVQVHTGGDVAFLNGVLKVLITDKSIDESFIRAHTTGFDELAHALEGMSFEELEQGSGASRDDMERFARMYAAADSAVLVWSMGITQHDTGSDNVAAIVNLGLARGNVGRRGAGLMPIRGHSGVQGGAEMGAYATALPGGVGITEESAKRLSDQWQFDVPARQGLTAPEMLEAASRGEIDVLYSSGGNFLEVLPHDAGVEEVFDQIPLRVHQDIVVSSQMLVDGDTVVLLPAATRYEQRDGGTETTTERRIVFSPQVASQPVGEARSEWEIFSDLAAKADPARAHLMAWDSGTALREEIARIVPLYAGVEGLVATGDSVQWGGRQLCEDGVFPTPDGRGRFTAVVSHREPQGTRLRLSTRRGKQFNTMIFKDKDPLTGTSRDALFIGAEDASRLGVHDRDQVRVRSDHGVVTARAHVCEIRTGNVQMFWPEANPLLPGTSHDQRSGVPDYNALVDVEPLPTVAL